MDGHPPVGQNSAHAIVNNCPQTQCEASIGGTNHTAGKGITVRSLMQGETILIQRYHCEPAKCTLLSCKSAELSSAAGNSDFSVVAGSC